MQQVTLPEWKTTSSQRLLFSKSCVREVAWKRFKDILKKVLTSWNWSLSGATTLGQSGPGSNGDKGVLCIPQSSSITGTSLSDYLVLYPGHSLGGSYPSAEVQSVYSTALMHFDSTCWETQRGVRFSSCEVHCLILIATESSKMIFPCSYRACTN